MIRNKIRNLITIKRGRGQASNNKESANGKVKEVSQLQASLFARWEQQFFHEKEVLRQLNKANVQIMGLVSQYEANPSIFNLKQLEKIINSNCKLIDQTDSWISHFHYSSPNSIATQQFQINLSTHFKQLLCQQIKIIYQSKQRITEISQLAQARQKSFNAFNQSANISYNSLNNSKVEDRDQLFREVNSRIENLNVVMRRMGVAVAEQSDLVNRIDLNLMASKQSMNLAKGQLKGRQRRQLGEEQGEFSCAGRINTTITALYIVNLVLILIFVLKNM